MRSRPLTSDPRRLLAGLILLTVAAVMLFPLLWMMASAFKSASDVYGAPGGFLPSKWTLANFRALFEMIPFGRYMMNSLLISAGSVLLTLLIAAPASYALVWTKLPARRLVRGLFALSLMLPAVVSLLPLYIGFARLNLIDTYMGLLIPQLNVAFSVLFLSRFFAAVPGELIASARLDGCSAPRILRHVVLPSSKGPLLTAAFFTFISTWKAYLWPLMITASETHRTIPIGLSYLMSESASDYPAAMAGALLTSLPALLILLLTGRVLARRAPQAELVFDPFDDSKPLSREGRP